MLSSKIERFAWSKQDRMADVTFFRLLCQTWHPVTRVLAEERHARYGRYGSALDENSYPTKPVWTPWLWMGR